MVSSDCTQLHEEVDAVLHLVHDADAQERARQPGGCRRDA